MRARGLDWVCTRDFNEGKATNFYDLFREEEVEREGAKHKEFTGCGQLKKQQRRTLNTSQEFHRLRVRACVRACLTVARN